jgi:hypothetical protein
VRNFVDAVASLKPFLRDHGRKFADMWGNFPPQAGMPEPEDMNYERYVLEDMGGGKGQMEVFLVEFLKAWWPFRKANNVIFVHYADRVRSHRDEIERISKFIGIDLLAEEVDLVADHTTFASMRAQSDRFSIRHIFDDFIAEGKVPKDVVFVEGTMVHSGPVRQGSEELTPSLTFKIETKIDEIFGVEIANWIRQGGELPDVDLPR